MERIIIFYGGIYMLYLGDYGSTLTDEAIRTQARAKGYSELIAMDGHRLVFYKRNRILVVFPNGQIKSAAI